MRYLRLQHFKTPHQFHQHFLQKIKQVPRNEAIRNCEIETALLRACIARKKKQQLNQLGSSARL